MNTNNNQWGEEFASGESETVQRRTFLAELFFTPKTVEDQFLLGKFSQAKLDETRGFIWLFSDDDVSQMLLCRSPECLHDTAVKIISRIRAERGSTTFTTAEMQKILGRFHNVFTR